MSTTTEPITVGSTYTFYSTLQGIDGYRVFPCLYTGRLATVLEQVSDATEEREAMYRVRFEDGAITSVWEGEINGYFLHTGQFHGPFAVEVRPGDNPADFEINRRAQS